MNKTHEFALSALMAGLDDERRAVKACSGKGADIRTWYLFKLGTFGLEAEVSVAAAAFGIGGPTEVMVSGRDG